MLKQTLRILTVFVIMGAAVPVLADLSPVEDPTTIGSWTQQFLLVNFQAFDTVVVETHTPGVELEAGGHEGMGNFWSLERFWVPDAGWSGDLESPTRATATGPGVHELFFNLYFSSDISMPLDFTFATYSSGRQIVRGTAHWSGQDTTDRPLKGFWSIGEATNVPEPSTLIWQAGWLLGVGLLILKRRRSLPA
jgi:hypothetical protein